jgi:hypothetical protein
MRAICGWSALLVAAGCSSVEPPRLLHPGTAATQRTRAEQFDPYPLPELGPPTEARPRGFLLPQPDAERMQNAESYYDRFRQSPPPGIYRAPRSVPTSAIPIMTMPQPQGSSVFVP